MTRARYSDLILLPYILGMLLLGMTACSEKEFDPNDPGKSFAVAREPYDDENYEIAIQRLGEFKTRFPYSQYAIEAELLIANSHFARGQYEEATVAYEQFVKLHPKHPQVDFAMFRIGESYWTDAPDEVNRDQELTRKAVEEWEKLIKAKPDSPYTAKAKELVATGRRRVAENMRFVARFYCKQEVYHACAFRYVELAHAFPDFRDMREEALTKAAQSFDRLAKQKEKKADSDKNMFFNTMSPQDLRARAEELRSEAKQLKQG